MEATKPITVPVNQACRMLGIGRTTFYKLSAEGRIKTILIGNKRLAVYESLEALVKGQAA